MPWRTLVLLIALIALPVAAGAAVVSEPADRAGGSDAVLAVTEHVETIGEVTPHARLRDATLTVPVPATIALFGAALCGLGLLYRARG